MIQPAITSIRAASHGGPSQCSLGTNRSPCISRHYGDPGDSLCREYLLLNGLSWFCDYQLSRESNVYDAVIGLLLVTCRDIFVCLFVSRAMLEVIFCGMRWEFIGGLAMASEPGVSILVCLIRVKSRRKLSMW